MTTYAPNHNDAFNQETVKFAAGRIRGLRSFKVLPRDGSHILAGCVCPVQWHAEGNEAEHWATTIWDLYPPGGGKHKVAGKDCHCGFYAHTDGKDDYRVYQNTVTGIIEGWGRVTIGSRGFRAEKARIVAFIDDKPEKFEPEPLPEKPVLEHSRWERLLLWLAVKNEKVGVPLVWTLILAPSLLGVLFGWLALGLAFAALLAVMAGVSLLMDKGDDLATADAHVLLQWALECKHVESKNLLAETYNGSRQRAKGVDEVLAKAEFKDIPVYRTLEEALEKHPLGAVYE